MTERTVSTVWGDIETRIVGGILVSAIVWVMYDMFWVH